MSITESQLTINQERLRLLSKLRAVNPEVMNRQKAYLDEIYKEGALPVKIKRLMAMAIALRVGCINCILSQAIQAIEAGASTQEVIETLGVVQAQGGTNGTAESLRVIKLLEEMGKI